MDTLAAPRTATADRREPGWWYRESRRSSLYAILIAVVGGLLIGGLTSFGQGYLPVWVNSVSNSVGGWTMFCFLIVWLSRARPVLAAVLGVLVFQLLVESYSVVSEWRGFDDGDPFTSVWTVAGLAAGPLLGATAGLVRHAPPLWRALAVTPLCAVLLGEGLWALTAVADTTSPVYWWLEILLSVVFLLAAVLRCRVEPQALPVVVCVWLVGALAYIGVIVGILS